VQLTVTDRSTLHTSTYDLRKIKTQTTLCLLPRHPYDDSSIHATPRST
jgi:hypothetical protein